MRRKSERTVKNSPTKKTEPTNRRTSRRTRKSPEKPINEDESEHSSDQASSSESEAEEVIAPKRTRRTSRTIEKSSSAEEVKATTTTTTRPRRRTTAKKESDIKEEEFPDTEQTTLNELKETDATDESVEKTESTNVDSSSEPVASQALPENSNNIQPDDSEQRTTSNETENLSENTNEIIIKENKKENKKDVVDETNANANPTITETVKVDIVPVEMIKSRRRTLKRLDKEHIVDEVSKEIAKPVEKEPLSNEIATNEADTHDKTPNKSSIEENNEAVKDSGEVINGSNIQSDPADTTAKDTTTSETDSSAKLNKKKTIVRKRKWLTNKLAAPKVQEITISTDSLKGLISDVKPVPLSDVQLDSSPEADHESDDVKVVSSTSIDYNRRSEEHLCESTDDGNAINISTSRKISIVNESKGEQPLSPAKHNPCNILYITNLVRPFTVLQLKSLLQRTGKITDDGFWIDKIKSKCFVKYETEDEAIETRHALHGIRWPTSNPKCLNVDFGNEGLMEKAVSSTADDVKLNFQPRDERIVSSNDVHDPARERAQAVERPVREWDLGKKDSHRPREAERAERDKEREQKPRETGRDDRERERDRDRERERDRERDRDRERGGDRERGDRRRRSTSVSPGRKYTKKDNEPPLRLLDDLFRKTKTTPCIYWLPLTPEQIAVRIEERKKAIERREAMRKEREREDAEERQRRREREKRREESRERDKRREDSRDKDKRRDESRDQSNRDRTRDERGDAGRRRRY